MQQPPDPDAEARDSPSRYGSGRGPFRQAGQAVDEIRGIGVSGEPAPQAFDPRFLIA